MVEKNFADFLKKGPNKKYTFNFIQYTKTGDFKAVQTAFMNIFKNLELF